MFGATYRIYCIAIIWAFKGIPTENLALHSYKIGFLAFTLVTKDWYVIGFKCDFEKALASL